MDDEHKYPHEKQPCTKVTPIRRPSSKPVLDDRLEELRRLLQETEPLDDELSDAEVIRDEKKFRRRFGPGFDWPRRDREGLISLKHEKDLTDQEIKLFRHTGNLSRGPFGVGLSAKRWMAWLGVAQLVYFGLLLMTLLAGLNSSILNDPWRAALLAAFLVGLFAGSAVVFLLYIKPWLVQKRTDRQALVGNRV